MKIFIIEALQILILSAVLIVFALFFKPAPEPHYVPDRGVILEGVNG